MLCVRLSPSLRHEKEDVDLDDGCVPETQTHLRRAPEVVADEGASEIPEGVERHRKATLEAGKGEGLCGLEKASDALTLVEELALRSWDSKTQPWRWSSEASHCSLCRSSNRRFVANRGASAET